MKRKIPIASSVPAHAPSTTLRIAVDALPRRSQSRGEGWEAFAENLTLLVEQNYVAVSCRVNANVCFFIVLVREEWLDNKILQFPLGSLDFNRFVDSFTNPVFDRVGVSFYVDETELTSPLNQLIRLHNQRLQTRKRLIVRIEREITSARLISALNGRVAADVHERGAVFARIGLNSILKRYMRKCFATWKLQKVHSNQITSLVTSD